jgi:hypothetical protein
MFLVCMANTMLGFLNFDNDLGRIACMKQCFYHLTPEIDPPHMLDKHHYHLFPIHQRRNWCTWRFQDHFLHQSGKNNKTPIHWCWCTNLQDIFGTIQLRSGFENHPGCSPNNSRHLCDSCTAPLCNPNKCCCQVHLDVARCCNLYRHFP